MHEIGIVRQILRTVESFAEKNGVKDIREVVVDCGELFTVHYNLFVELAGHRAGAYPASRPKV